MPSVAGKKRLPTISWATPSPSGTSASASPGRPARAKTDRHGNSPQALRRERIRAANGRQVHVNCGGARAWACEPAGRWPDWGQVKPDHGVPAAHKAETRRKPVALNRPAGMGTLQRYSSRVDARGWPVWLPWSDHGRSSVVADHGRAEGVGLGDAGSPAGCDRCKNLHRQRNQDYGQKIPQPPAHRQVTHPIKPNNHQQSPSRGGVPGIMLNAAMK